VALGRLLTVVTLTVPMWWGSLQCGATGCEDDKDDSLIVPLVVGGVALCLVVAGVVMLVRHIRSKRKRAAVGVAA